MKNTLLGTTALVGASMALAGAASAQIKVSVHGKVDFQAGFVSKDFEGFPGGSNGTASTSADRGYAFVTDSELVVRGQGKSRAGLRWRAQLELEADPSNRGGSPTKRVSDDTHLRLWGSWGMVQLGSIDGVADKMTQHSGFSAYGTGGANGDWDWWLNERNMLGAGQFLSSPKPRDSGDAAKVTYYTPRVGGFQAGISFAPDRGGHGNDRTNDNDADEHNFVEWGVAYKAKHSGVGINVAVTGGFSDFELPGSGAAPSVADREGTGALAIGGNFTFGGWSAGLGYGTNDDSNQPTAAALGSAAARKVTWWDAAVGYGQGPFGVSLSYFRSNVEIASSTTNFGDDSQSVYILGTTYKLGKGLKVYGDLAYAETKTDNPADTLLEGDGTALIVGIEGKF